MDYQRRSRRTPSRGAAPASPGRMGPTSPSRGPADSSSRGRKLPVLALVLIDLAGAAIIFGALYGYYSIPKAGGNSTPIPLPHKTATVQPSPSTTAVESAAATGSAQAATGSAQAEQTPQPVNTPAVDAGQFGARFADKFSDGAGQFTQNGYQSRDVNIAITKNQKTNDDGSTLTYYVADIYVRNLENFRSAFAKDTFGSGFSDTTLNIAGQNHAILAISGDYYGNHPTGPVVRNGTLYRNDKLDDVCVLYNDGTMKTFEADQYDAADIEKNGAWQVWSFGPQLLKDGQPMTTFNSTLNPKNPRAAIGYYEPGHYCFVLVDGRASGYSDGITLKAFSQLFYDLGCKAAYNLDGGQTAVLAFNGKWVNQPYKDGRAVSDILYIGEKQ